MARPVLVFSLLSLVAVSVLPVYADAGVMTVVAGKTYQVPYVTNGVQIQSLATNPTYDEITASVQVSSPNASLELTIPRSLLDSKQGSSDIPFIAVIDGTLGNIEEKNPTPDTRTIMIQLAPDNKQVEIIGTYVAMSGPSGGVSQAPASPSGIPAGGLQAANRTVPTQAPTKANTGGENPSMPAPTHASTPESLGANPTTSNATQNMVIKIPYLSNAAISLSYVDMAVIGAIVIVIVIVIASVTRKNGRLVTKSS